MVERGGFEPPKAEPADLQSAPFNHSGTSPSSVYLEPAKGVEPPTHWLQISCSANWATLALILKKLIAEYKFIF